jgi:hypothetical protein
MSDQDKRLNAPAPIALVQRNKLKLDPVREQSLADRVAETERRLACILDALKAQQEINTVLSSRITALARGASDRG